MRIVSLVPSDTYTLIRLGGGPSLVGRTKYCVEPLGEVDSIETVGGTKDPNTERIIELAPDLVILNQEENTKSDVAKLEAAGLRTVVTFPKTVEQGVQQVARLARLLGPIDSLKKELVRFAYRAHIEAETLRKGRIPLRAFVPIWVDPWMTIHGDTYLSDQLDLAGATNVFADRRRRYPLAADLGDHAPLSPERVGERDTRYPRITLDEVRERQPEIVLLPDEPYAFGEQEAEMFRSLDIPAAHNDRIRFCNGRDLMWPGLRGLEGLARLSQLVHSSD
jgi:ABC-type Fe3+-hydroxamate transport system substrate-binding protein